MAPTDLAQAVLALVRRSNYQPVKPKVLAKKLGLNQEASRNLKRVIKRLVKRGELQYGKNHLVLDGDSTDTPPSDATSEDATTDGSSPNSKRNSHGIPGVFRRMAAGYGFVRPSNTPRSEGKHQDIYIAAKNTRDASSGDTVLVRLNKKGRPGKPGPEGAIIEVIERETNRFVGTYFERGGQGLVEIDGKVFSQAISVGDPGAKGAQNDDKVVLEMVRFPSHSHDGEGVLVEVLGPHGAPGVDTLSIIHEYNLPGDFADVAMDDARQQASKFDESIGSGRVDMTDLTVITIDPEDARDFDDAISLAKIENGHWLLDVHIADVSHFVRTDSPLDQEARDRATSVYLPDRVIPMLPEVISNNLASLQPDRVRYCMTARIEFTSEGTVVGCEVHKSAIKSRRRFTYEEVDDYLSRPAAWKKKLTPEVHKLLGQMHKLAMILRQRRFHRGSLELSMPEVKIDLDSDGRVSGAHLTVNTESHQIIEEFMLAANEAVGRRLADAGLAFMRRIHEAPDPRKLKALTEFVHDLGFKTESLESRFAIQHLLSTVEGMPQQHAVNYAVLRSMQKAIYSPAEEGHYALASECYCHFTSPIRRYPDLTIHRLLEKLITGDKPEQNLDRLYAVSEHCSGREQRATQAERELTKVKLLTYMSTRIGEDVAGIITGVEDFGLFVQGIEMPAEGFVHISSLQDDYYRFDRRTHSLTGNRNNNSYRLGDPVKVTVAHVDVGRRQLDFRMVGRLSRHPDRQASDRQERSRKKTTKAKKSPQTSEKRSGKPAKKKTGKPKPRKKTTSKKKTHRKKKTKTTKKKRGK